MTVSATLRTSPKEMKMKTKVYGSLVSQKKNEEEEEGVRVSNTKKTSTMLHYSTHYVGGITQ
jgi:hypothetical protein